MIIRFHYTIYLYYISKTNNIKEHFAKRLSKFISIFGGIYYDKHYKGEIKDKNSEEYTKIKKSLLYNAKKCIFDNTTDKIPELMVGWYNTVKDNLKVDNIEKTMAYDCKINPYKYVSISYYILTLL